MAINDADQAESDGLDGGDESTGASDEATSDGPTSDSEVRVGEYTWREFMREHGYEDDIQSLYRNVEDTSEDSSRMGLGTTEGTVQTTPDVDDWRRVDFNPEPYLGVHPTDLSEHITEDVAPNAKWLHEEFMSYLDPETTPVVKDVWTWEHFKWEYYYDEDGSRPRKSDGSVDEFDETEYLSFEDDEVEGILSQGDDFAQELADVVEERTVNIQEDIDEDEFFSDPGGYTTVVNRYDLEKAVPLSKKMHFREQQRYWVNKPYAFVIIFLSEKENEIKYYVIQPHMNELEDDLEEFMTGKLRTAIKYSDENVAIEGGEDKRREVIDKETKRLLRRYDLFKGTPASSSSAGAASGTQSIVESIQRFFGTAETNDTDASAGQTAEDVDGEPVDDVTDDTATAGDENGESTAEDVDGDLETADHDGGLAAAGETGSKGGYGRELEGIKARPEPVVLEEDRETLDEYQVEKLLYFLKRDFIGYERIDPIKHDINVEDISCDGYHSPIFVYHSSYEQIITNIYHGERELDDFVVKLAQRSGKGISKRRPQVDATLPDGSRSQLTLGKEVSDHGTNYTIRQFKDVPFTPIDLINWNTFSLDEMAFLWLCIENHKSLIFAGGTASGKTTSLNAVSLFIPSNTKIVSIEDTREVELPQRNWVASVTRPSFSEDNQGDVDEFDLLRAALRQRPDYIVMGEIRGEEGRVLFQVMSTGHTTYTTFHADSVGEVLKRFTTDPINVSKTMFTALDLVSIQTETRVGGNKVRRNRNITEINHYDAENDEINVQDVYQWQAETDEFLKMGESNTLDEIKFDRGWNQEKLEDELFKRRAILAYLIKNGLNEYAQVAATVQAFINDPDTILALIANGQLEESLQDLREMESVLINVDPEDEKLVPRPDPDDETFNLSQDILERAEESMFEEYRGKIPSGLASALSGVQAEEDVDPTDEMEDSADDFDFGSSLDDVGGDDGFVLGDDEGDEDFSFGGEDDSGPSWLSDDGGGFSFGDESDPFEGESDGASADADSPPSPPSETPQLESGTASGEPSASGDEVDGSDRSPAGAGTASDASGSQTAGAEEPDAVFEDSDAGNIDAEFPELTETGSDDDPGAPLESSDVSASDASETSTSPADGSSSDASASDASASDASPADASASDASPADGSASDASAADASASEREASETGASAAEPAGSDETGSSAGDDAAIFGEGASENDPESVFDEVESDGSESESSFFGDDDEPFFDDEDEESIFGDSDGAIFDDSGEDDDGDGSVFGDDSGDGGERQASPEDAQEDSVFGSSGDGVFDDGGDDEGGVDDTAEGEGGDDDTSASSEAQSDEDDFEGSAFGGEGE